MIRVIVTGRARGSETFEADGDQLAQLEADTRKFIKTLSRPAGPYIARFLDEDGEEIRKFKLMGGRFVSSARALERRQNIRLEKPDPTGPGVVDINPITEDDLSDIREEVDTEPREMRGIARDDSDSFISEKRDVEQERKRKLTMREFFDINRNE